MAACPKCGFEGRDPESCEKCGIVFDRMRTVLDAAPVGAGASRSSPPPPPVSGAFVPLGSTEGRPPSPEPRTGAGEALSIVEQTLARSSSAQPASAPLAPAAKLAGTGPSAALELARERRGRTETPAANTPIALQTVGRYHAVGERRRVALWLVLLALVSYWWWTSRETERPGSGPAPSVAVASDPGTSAGTAVAALLAPPPEVPGAAGAVGDERKAGDDALAEAAYLELAAESLLRDVRAAFVLITDAAEARPLLEADRKRLGHLAGLIDRTPLPAPARDAYRRGLAAMTEFLEVRVTTAIGIAETSPGRAEKLDHTLLRTADAAFAEARRAAAARSVNAGIDP